MSDNHWRFDIEAMPEPQSLPRIIGYFAQLSIVPAEMSMRIVADVMHIAVVADDLPAGNARVIAAKLAELFVVFGVELMPADTFLQV